MTFAELINSIIASVVNPLIVLVSSLAVLYFLWGVSKYILHSGNEEKRAEGYQMMIYGIIALFVMVSVWGLVGVLANTFLGGLGGGGGAPNSFNFGFGVNVSY
jgi:hypothetical protein